EWKGESAIICYFSVLTEGSTLNEQIEILRKRAEDGLPDWGETGASKVLPFSMSTMVDAVCVGSVAVIFPKTNQLLKITIPNITVRSPDEPANETVIRGAHEGFVESNDKNIS
ncbi:spore germination protein, partial [Microvirga sp. 3-52]|nr:spore germination protein [Microvirga sp. 3-52]